ncbi:MAG: hypothetical protein WC436_05845 [Candidatus Babeliales bacterium]
MAIKDFLLILLPVISGIVGSYVTYYLTMKSKKSEAIFRYKEEKYSNLFVLLKGFVGKTASGDLKRKFFDEQYKSWLYCSDDVVKAINNMVRLVIDSKGQAPDSQRGRKAVGEIVRAMRKDLLGKTKLQFDDFVYTDVID